MRCRPQRLHQIVNPGQCPVCGHFAAFRRLSRPPHCSQRFCRRRKPFLVSPPTGLSSAALAQHPWGSFARFTRASFGRLAPFPTAMPSILPPRGAWRVMLFCVAVRNLGFASLFNINVYTLRRSKAPAQRAPHRYAVVPASFRTVSTSGTVRGGVRGSRQVHTACIAFVACSHVVAQFVIKMHLLRLGSSKIHDRAISFSQCVCVCVGFPCRPAPLAGDGGDGLAGCPLGQGGRPGRMDLRRSQAAPPGGLGAPL